MGGARLLSIAIGLLVLVSASGALTTAASPSASAKALSQRELLLQQWSAFILTNVKQHAMRMASDPEYNLPKSVEESKANADANPSQQAPKGSSGVQTGPGLDPPMNDGPTTMTSTVGVDTSKYPETEGYHPPLGYFVQSPECDAAMRAWLPNCAFVDHPRSLYWESTANTFPPTKTPESSANYIGNMMFNDEAEIALGENSQERQAQRAAEEAPTF